MVTNNFTVGRLQFIESRDANTAAHVDVCPLISCELFDYVRGVAANRELASLQTISRTPDAQGTPIQDVCVDHRRADIRVAEQFLHHSDVVSVLEQMRRKGVAEGVAADALRDPRPADLRQ